MSASSETKEVTVNVRHSFEWFTETMKEGDVWLWMRNNWITSKTMTVVIRRWGFYGVVFIVYQMDGKKMDVHPCLSFDSKDFLNNEEGFESFVEFILTKKEYFDSFSELLIHQKVLLQAFKRAKGRTDTFSYATKKRKAPVSAVAAEKRPKTNEEGVIECNHDE
jgi:hypothetical protein